MNATIPLRMPRIVPLARAGTAGLFGGKAAGLARLIEAGARVPDGVALEASDRPLAEWPVSDVDALRACIAALLRSGAIAVRSSAVGEDSDTKSYAGLFETSLDVVDVEAALTAVERGLRSGRSERVRAYSGNDGVIPVGLVVQRQVQARAAGVAFTIDPQGRDRAILIEAVSGRGDALVSGRVAPERWRVYRTGLGTLEARRDPDGARGVLTEATAGAIAAEAIRLAERLGQPLDLEWAADDARLHWLQARPITAAKAPIEWVIDRFHSDVDDGPVSVWSNFNVRETMPLPLSPLNESVWREIVLPGVFEDVLGFSRRSPLARQLAAVDFVHGRPYWNLNAMLAGPLGRLLPRLLQLLDARAADVARGLMAAGVLRPRRLPKGELRLALHMALTAVRSAARLLLSLRPRKTLRDLEAYGREVRKRPVISSLSDPGLVDEMGVLFAPDATALRRANQALAIAILIWGVADRAFRAAPRARKLLTAGLGGNPTTAISLGIGALAAAGRPLRAALLEARGPAWRERVAAEPGGAAWLGLLDGFLAENGQRCPREFELSVPRWIDEPGMVLALVRAGLEGPASEGAAERLERLAAERARAIGEACARSPPWKRPLLRLLARLVEAYMPLREAPKHYAMFAFLRMRQAALEIGRRLVARGRLDAAEDVFFLEWPEAWALLLRGEAAGPDRPRDAVAHRRRRLARFERERPPDFLRSDLVPVPDGAPALPDVGDLLAGVGCSTGTGEGPVRILREPDPSALRAGDVLVVEFADPGWTPLFPRAAAVVMEVGGFLCHAAVVARELGVPAVFGLKDATRRLSDGEVVRVDGDGGSVLRLNRPA